MLLNTAVIKRTSEMWGISEPAAPVAVVLVPPKILFEKYVALALELRGRKLALKDVARSITPEGLERSLRIVQHDLIERFAIARPRIAVAGLNPHAGESGHLGREEIDVIIPVLDKLRSQGFDLVGPLPADTLFNPERLRRYDCVLAMYHDQGLPVLKYASFGSGINVTLGLPIVRTSVDHGTALELAGSGGAEVGSLLEAVKLAAELAVRGKQRAAALHRPALSSPF